LSYLREFPIDKTLEIIGRLIDDCSTHGPLSYSLKKLFDEGKYLELIDFEFDYEKAYSKDDFLYARQIQGFLKKQDFLDLGINREDVAWKTFKAAEDLCRNTNERFRSGLAGESSAAHSILFIAARKIASILGDVPTYDELKFSFGPGATTSVKRARSHPRVKLEAPMTCSTSFVPHAKEFLAEFPGWVSSHLDNENCLRLEVSHAKLQFVPKTSKTLRSIGVEPTLNGLGQKGIGTFLKRKLKRAGVDLSDQTRNQKLAKQGSETGLLSTVDLSSASDTISYGLVMHLLPWDWFDLLDRFRSPCVSYKNEVIRLEKFSSMGNSYTFELESLIFYSIAYSVCSYLGLDTKDVSCYGDDIIIPTSAYGLLEEILIVCGFVVNKSKSYFKGPFRESCGADYLVGFDIRPFYLKDRVNVRILFLMHNWFIRNCEPKLAKLIIEYIPSHMRIFGPDGFGDGHLIGSHQLRTSRKLRRAGYEGGFFDTYVAVANRIKLPELSDYVYPTYSIYAQEETLEQASENSLLEPVDPVHDIVPGFKCFRRLSIYTLRTTIFAKTKPAKASFCFR